MIGFPFDSHVTYDEYGVPSYDRAISSAPYRKLLHELYKDGIMPTDSTNMQVVTGEGMTVKVQAGFAMIRGCMKLEEEVRTLAVQASDNNYDRIDTVVLRLDTNDNVRVCDFYVISGTPASSPVRPTLTRNASVYELGLADLFIAKNSSAIAQYRITDTRYEDARCGVLSSISEFPINTIYAQVQAELNRMKDVHETNFDNYFDSEKDRFSDYTDEQRQEYLDYFIEKQNEFMAWFENLQTQLDTDVAGHLQNQCDEFQARITNIEEMAINNDYFAPLTDDDEFILVDDNDYAILAEWSVRYAGDARKFRSDEMQAVDRRDAIPVSYLAGLF